MRRFVPILFAAAVLLAAAGPGRAQETPEAKFWKACRNGDVATVKEMLDKGMNVNARFEGGATPILAATMRGQLEVVRLLVERGADPAARDETFKLTPLGLATLFGQMGIAEFLLPRTNADMDLILIIGAQRGIPSLVQAGLKGKITEQDKTIALVLAKAGKNAEIPALLEKAGAQAPPTVKPEDLPRFTGEFRNDKHQELQIVLRDGKLLGTGGEGFSVFFEEQMIPIGPQTLFLTSDPTRTFHFEGSGASFNRVTVTSLGGSYTMQKTKGEGK